MGEVNVLSGGVEVLEEMKANLVRLEEMKTRSEELGQRQKQLGKDIEAKEKAMASEIDATIAKRHSEIEASYDGQIDKTRDRIKMVKAKREKMRDSKVSERIDVETADLKEELRELKQDLKGVFKRNRIPRIFNTGYFFALFMPGEFVDFCVILLSVIIMLAIPVGAWFLVPEKLKKIWILVIAYIVVIVLFMGIFMLIFKKVRTKHSDALKEAKQIRRKIARTRKRTKKAEKNIRNDKDDSSYGLEKIDEELQELDASVESIIREKKDALKEFETTAKQDVIAQIRAGYESEIQTMRTENEAAYDEQRSVDEQVKSATLEISRKYESYVGKEVLSVAMIDSLIDIINGGDALNIADALAYYKKRQAEEK